MSDRPLFRLENPTGERWRNVLVDPFGRELIGCVYRFSLRQTERDRLITEIVAATAIDVVVWASVVPCVAVLVSEEPWVVDRRPIGEPVQRRVRVTSEGIDEAILVHVLDAETGEPLTDKSYAVELDVGPRGTECVVKIIERYEP